MTGPAEDAPGTPAAETAAARAAREAARERQSHMRHDLRAPLAVIYPLLSLLLDEGTGELTAQQREYLQVLERNVVRLEALVTGVADSGWADCSAAPALAAEIAPADVVEEVITVRRIDDRGGPSIDLEVGPLPSPRIWADRDDVRQIIASLVRNAEAYTPAAGRIAVRIRSGEDADTIAVEVVDTGPGMPPEELARAFEFGFRGALATQLRAPGLGAGLWICRELAARNGGSLTLTSEPGAGLRAILVLPAATMSGDAADRGDVARGGV
jgi:signal transduction histidine kinase